MLTYAGYPKVWQLGHRFLFELLLDPVLVQEKVDGSQFSFAMDSDKGLRIWSHHREIDLNEPDKLFSQGVESVKARAHALRPDWIYRSEYLQKPKHHTLAYGRIPLNHIVIFDIQDGLESYVGYDTLALEASRLELDVIPLVFEGMVSTAKDVEGYLSRESFLGGPIEGVVLKNYKRFGMDGKALMGKYVSERFKEQAKLTFKGATDADIIQGLVDSLNTEALWLKGLQTLAENGTLKNDLPDIGPLMAAVKQDVKTESLDQILATVDQILAKRKGDIVAQVIKGIGRGIPEWYKARLLERQFPVEEGRDG